MIRLEARHIDEFLAADPLAARLEAAPSPFTSHRWLVQSAAKRMIYHRLYGDLLVPDAPRRRIADVGGGLTGLTPALVRGHDYTLIDILAHDPADAVAALERDLGARFVVAADWHELTIHRLFDIVIANDLFPNVDQRLALFLARFLPCCRELRLLVTFHNLPRFYPVKRVDGDEVMWMLAWTGQDVARAVEPFADRVIGEPLPAAAWTEDRPSLFANDRQVAIVRLRGDAAPGAAG